MCYNGYEREGEILGVPLKRKPSVLLRNPMGNILPGEIFKVRGKLRGNNIDDLWGSVTLGKIN